MPAPDAELPRQRRPGVARRHARAVNHGLQSLACSEPSTSPSTTPSATASARFCEQAHRAAPRRLGGGRHRRRRGLARGRQAGPARHRRPGGVRRRRGQGLPLQLRRRRGDRPRRRQRRRLHACTTTSSAPYLLKLTTDEQKQRWLPGFARGELITAIAMTEPGAGLGPAGAADARATKDGDDWVLSTAPRRSSPTASLPTSSSSSPRPTRRPRAPAGFSLLVVERGMQGFERGRNLDKVGMKAQDTAELFFDDVRVPADEPARRGGRRLHPPDGGPAAGAAVDRRRRGRRGAQGARH